MHRVTVAVEALQRGSVASSVSTTQNLTPTVGASLDGGYLRRARGQLGFGDQGVGGGFRFKLSDWRGLMIHRVTAIVEMSPADYI